MKNLFTLLIWISVIGMLSAQEISSRSFAVKNYFSLEIQKRDINYLRVSNVGFVKDSVESVDVKLVRPAFNIFTKRGNLHEFEIVDFKLLEEETISTYIFDSGNTFFRGNFGEATEKTNRIEFRYQYSFALWKRKSKFYIGGGVQTYFEKTKVTPINDDPSLGGPIIEGIVTNNKRMGTNFHIVPRLIIPIKKRMFIDIHTLFSVYKLEQLNYERSQSAFNSQVIQFKATLTEYFPALYEFSIGIGYKF